MRPLTIIVAVDELGGFARKGEIPWNIPEDLKRFKEITANNICIMGRRTYQDICKRRFAPKLTVEDKSTAMVHLGSLLPGRECYVLSKSLIEKHKPVKGVPTRLVGDAIVKSSLREAVESIHLSDTRKIFVLGGERVFREALPWTLHIYLTIVKGYPFDCDRYFPIKYVKEYFTIESGKETEKTYNMIYKRIKR